MHYPVDERLMSKNGRVAVLIARELFDTPVGAQIPRVTDYARRMGVGNGTVQEALHVLTAMGAIQLESRGQFGTFLVGIDRMQTRKVAGLGGMLGSMPLPYSRRYEGLATALYEVASRREMPLSLNYMRGGVMRLDALMRANIDFTVVSAMAFEVHQRTGHDLTLIALLPEGTYVGDHAVLFSDPREESIRDGMVLGVDPNSIDQVELTRAETTGHRVRLVEAPYTVLLDKLLRNEIDALIWNADEVQIRHPGVVVRPLQSEVSRQLSRQHTQAAVVARADRAGVVELLRQVLDPDDLAQVQAEVLSGLRLPSY